MAKLDPSMFSRGAEQESVPTPMISAAPVMPAMFGTPTTPRVPSAPIAPAMSVTPTAPVASVMPVTPMSPPRGSSKSGSGSIIIKIVRIFLELVLLAAVVYLTMWGYGLQAKNRDLQKQFGALNNNPAIVEQRKTDELIANVSGIMKLPANEKPQAALVSDSKVFIKQYPSFTKVQNGDQILFYVKTGNAIVYRPSTKKIVQTGPLSAAPAATTTAPATPTPAPATPAPAPATPAPAKPTP